MQMQACPPLMSICPPLGLGVKPIAPHSGGYIHVGCTYLVEEHVNTSERRIATYLVPLSSAVQCWP